MRRALPGSRWLVLPLLAAAAACEVSSEGPRDREAAGTSAMMASGAVDSIARTVRTDFTEWFERGGAASTMIPAKYAPDAIFSDEMGRTHSGRAALEASFEQMAPGSQIEIRSFGAVGSGDLLVDIGSYEVRSTLPNGQRGTSHGRYMIAYQRMDDGSWKVVRQLTTSDAPPPGGVAADDSTANRAFTTADSARSSIDDRRAPTDTFMRAPRR